MAFLSADEQSQGQDDAADLSSEKARLKNPPKSPPNNSNFSHHKESLAKQNNKESSIHTPSVESSFKENQSDVASIRASEHADAICEGDGAMKVVEHSIFNSDAYMGAYFQLAVKQSREFQLIISRNDGHSLKSKHLFSRIHLEVARRTSHKYLKLQPTNTQEDTLKKTLYLTEGLYLAYINIENNPNPHKYTKLRVCYTVPPHELKRAIEISSSKWEEIKKFNSESTFEQFEEENFQPGLGLQHRASRETEVQTTHTQIEVEPMRRVFSMAEQQTYYGDDASTGNFKELAEIKKEIKRLHKEFAAFRFAVSKEQKRKCEQCSNQTVEGDPETVQEAKYLNEITEKILARPNMSEEEDDRN